MSTRPTTVLIVGATGSIGRHAVVEAVHQGYRVRALVRNPARAKSLPEQAELVVGDLTRPDTLDAASTAVTRSSSPTARRLENPMSATSTMPASRTWSSLCAAGQRGSR